ncbi:MAG: hypothetical protein WC623_22520 [Pedobacter sp.]|uniref:hypothetical protein n=1 Tax=Pedobacter sp. TaxID=1411316 RepID=UPI0035664CCB
MWPEKRKEVVTETGVRKVAPKHREVRIGYGVVMENPVELSNNTLSDPILDKLLKIESFDYYYSRPNGHKDKVTLNSEDNDLFSVKLVFNQWNGVEDAKVTKIVPHETVEDEAAGHRNNPKFNWLKDIEYPIEFPTFTMVFENEDIPDKRTYWDGQSWRRVGFVEDSHGVAVQEKNFKDWMANAKIHPKFGRGLHRGGKDGKIVDEHKESQKEVNDLTLSDKEFDKASKLSWIQLLNEGICPECMHRLKKGECLIHGSENQIRIMKYEEESAEIKEDIRKIRNSKKSEAVKADEIGVLNTMLRYREDKIKELGNESKQVGKDGKIVDEHKPNTYELFLNTLSSMERGKVKKILDTSMRYRGVVETRREFIEQKVKEGGKVVHNKMCMYKKEEEVAEKLEEMRKDVPFGNQNYPTTKEYNRLKSELEKGYYKDNISIETQNGEYIEITKTEADYFNYITR